MSDETKPDPVLAALARIEASMEVFTTELAAVITREIYRRALRAMPETIDGQPPLPVPQTCPVTLDELLAEADAP